MPIVPVQCWLRTFKITGGQVSGTCFVISHRGQQWLITAKHIVDAAANAGVTDFQVTGPEGKPALAIQPEFVPLIEQGPDIAVFALGDHEIVRDELTLIPSAEKLILSQEAFFLGYPLPSRLQLVGLLPLVKHGVVSQRAVINGVTVWLIDGHNIPGFSGGPLVFNEGGGIGTIWHVLGVVSAYVTQQIAVTGGFGFVESNAGLVVVYDIKHAIDAIDAFLGNATQRPKLERGRPDAGLIGRPALVKHRPVPPRGCLCASHVFEVLGVHVFAIQCHHLSASACIPIRER